MVSCVCEKLKHPGVPCGDPRCRCHSNEGFTSNAPLTYETPSKTGVSGKIAMADITIKGASVTIEFRDAEIAEHLEQSILFNAVRGVKLLPTYVETHPERVKET